METLKIYSNGSSYDVTDPIEAFDWKRIAEEINCGHFAGLSASKVGNQMMLVEQLPDDEISLVASMSVKLYNSTIGYFKKEIKKAIKKAIENPMESFYADQYVSFELDEDTNSIEICIEDEDETIVRLYDIDLDEDIDLMVEDAFMQICFYNQV